MTRMAMARAFANLLLVLGFWFFAATFPLPARARRSEAIHAHPARFLSHSSPSQESAASNVTLAEFAWLAGRWQGTWGPRIAQQVWMPAQSGAMVGVFQLSENGQTLVIELYTILSTSNGIELRVRHFTPSLAAWEKSGPALLTLETIDSKSILFENEDNGQPKHWTMKRTDADSYIAQFEIVPKTGKTQIAQIVYHRQGGPAAPSH